MKKKLFLPLTLFVLFFLTLSISKAIGDPGGGGPSGIYQCKHTGSSNDRCTVRGIDQIGCIKDLNSNSCDY